MMNFNPSIHAPDSTTLVRALRELPRTRIAVADLSIGGWGAQSLATQWLGQILGRDVAPKIEGPSIEQMLSVGEGMCAGIDEEGRGNRALIQAHSTALQLARVLARVPTDLVVLLPGFGFTWRREDRLLADYLHTLSPLTSITLISTAPMEASKFVPPVNLAHAVPTALSPALKEALGKDASKGFLQLTNGWSIVAPECRLAGSELFDAVALARFAYPRLRAFLAFAMIHSRAGAVEPWQFCFEAWRQCYSGYREVALILVDLATAHAADTQSEAAMRAQKQAMRIANASYEDAAGEPPPAQGVEPEIAALIEGCRGWGMVMSNRPQDAMHSLRECLSLRSSDKPNKSDLLLMNIAALAELRAGYTERAVFLENTIEERLAELPGANGELVFVNSLNISRLRRYVGDYGEAERYLRKAFSTLEGARTETDQVNVDLCFARLATARGDAAAAFIHWTRAAVQWVACCCPEAINWRVQMLVIGNDRQIDIASSAEADNLVERLATGFIAALDQAAAAAGMVMGDDSAPARQFLPSDSAKSKATTLRLLGDERISLIAAVTDEKPRHQGVEMQRLRRRLTGWVEASWPAEGENAYLVDRRDGTGMPVEFGEQVASAIDHGVGIICLYDRALGIPPADKNKLCDARRIRISPIVATVDVKQANFKRYLRSYVFTETEKAIVSCARSAMTIGEMIDVLDDQGIPSADARQALVHLRQQRVIQLRDIDVASIESLVQ